MGVTLDHCQLFDFVTSVSGYIPDQSGDFTVCIYPGWLIPCSEQLNGKGAMDSEGRLVLFIALNDSVVGAFDGVSIPTSRVKPLFVCQSIGSRKMNTSSIGGYGNFTIKL